jgi:hypothetical protein
MGIEPTLSAWEAGALPLSYTRKRMPHYRQSRGILSISVGFVNYYSAELFSFRNLTSFLLTLCNALSIDFTCLPRYSEIS